MLRRIKWTDGNEAEAGGRNEEAEDVRRIERNISGVLYLLIE